MFYKLLNFHRFIKNSMDHIDVNNIKKKFYKNKTQKKFKIKKFYWKYGNLGKVFKTKGDKNTFSGNVRNYPRLVSNSLPENLIPLKYHKIKLKTFEFL